MPILLRLGLRDTLCGAIIEFSPDSDGFCYQCMNPPPPSEKWYYDGPGDQPGWQDSTFPNEY